MIVSNPVCPSARSPSFFERRSRAALYFSACEGNKDEKSVKKKKYNDVNNGDADQSEEGGSEVLKEDRINIKGWKEKSEDE